MATARKLFILASVLGLVSVPALRAEAKPMRLAVNALGSGTGADESSATAAAKSNAEGMLICAGTLEGVHSNSTGCAQTGDSYTCSAIALATCVIGS